MPNRTIYLPQDLDEMSRQLDLNLSHLTQRAIQQVAAERSEDALNARVDAASKRISKLRLSWPYNYLQTERREAGER